MNSLFLLLLGLSGCALYIPKSLGDVNGLNDPPFDLSKQVVQDDNFYDLMKKLVDFITETQKKKNEYTFNYAWNTSSVFLKCNLNLEDAIASGFSSINSSFEGPLTTNHSYSFKVSLDYKKLTVIAFTYDLDFNMLTMLPVNGSGRASMQLSGLNLDVTVYLDDGGNTDNILTANVDLDFSVDNIKVSITGLLDTEAQSRLISGVLSDIAAPLVMRYKHSIMLLAQPLLNYEINNYLKQYKVTMKLLIQIIQGIVGG